MRMFPHATARAIPVALLAAALVATSGCGWLRGKSVYEQAPESRPLEVPPDLDAPRLDPSMTIPGTATAARAAAGSGGAAFVISGAPDSAYRQVGDALERIDGVDIVERAQLLSAYNVRYRGETFLIRVSAADGGSRVSAATQGGGEASGGAADALLGLLRQRLAPGTAMVPAPQAQGASGQPVQATTTRPTARVGFPSLPPSRH